MRLRSGTDETNAAIVATLRRQPAKEIRVMTTPMYAVQGTSIVRRTAVVLAVAGAGFITGALLHSPIGFRDVSAAFAQPAQAAQSNLLQTTPATGTIAPAGADEWAPSDGERIFEPRECDLPKGISTACLFLD
jgi:hypothetical protein